MDKIVVIIDLHCDASLPIGMNEFGGGNKYSRNLISFLLSLNITFFYFTYKRFDSLEDTVKLSDNSFFYRLNVKNMVWDSNNSLQYYKEEIAELITSKLSNKKEKKFIFHSIYWHSGIIAEYLSEKFHSFFIHTVVSCEKAKQLQGINEDIAPERTGVEQYVFSKAKTIICSSIAEAENIHKLYQIPQEKICVTGRWVEREFLYPDYDLYGNPSIHSFTNDADKYYLDIQNCGNIDYDDYDTRKAFLYVGRLQENKGLRQILQSWERLYLKYNDLTPPLWIIGGTPAEIKNFKKNYLQDITSIEKAEATYHLIWWGILSPKSISAVMLKCQVFIAHSKYESGGNVILEAMAHRLPVIATPFGYAKDYIRDWENGFLVSYGNVELLCQYMEYFIKQPYLANYMGRKARNDLDKILLNFDFKNIHLKLYGFSDIKRKNTFFDYEIPKDSIDLYYDRLCIPDKAMISHLVIQAVDFQVLEIKDRQNKNNYYIWEIITGHGNLYFYYLYTVFNRKCIEGIADCLLLTKHYRIQLFLSYLEHGKSTVYYTDLRNGYILLDKEYLPIGE